VASIARSQTPLSSRACGANQLGEAQALSSLARRSYRRLSRSAERSCTTRRHARCAPARRATATVVWPVSRRVTPRRMWFNSIASIPRSQPAKRKLGSDKGLWRQRSSRGHLLHHAGTAGAVAQAATRRVVARPSPLRSRLSRSAALPRHERAASSRRRESGDYMPGRRSATAPAVPW
jgi:hypothetical protein